MAFTAEPYEITSIQPLSEPIPLGKRNIVAQFTVRIGPVELRSCGLTQSTRRGYGIAWSTRYVVVDSAIRNEIKDRVRDAYKATSSRF